MPGFIRYVYLKSGDDTVTEDAFAATYVDDVIKNPVRLQDDLDGFLPIPMRAVVERVDDTAVLNVEIEVRKGEKQRFGHGFRINCKSGADLSRLVETSINNTEQVLKASFN